MKLFEYIHDDDFYIHKLEKYFNSLGFKANPCQPPSEECGWALDVSDNEDFEYDWQHPEKNQSGMFFYLYPNWKKDFDSDDVRFVCHINSIVIAKNRQGQGLARKFIEGIINIMGYDLEIIEFHDESKGFWKYIEQKYPNITFRFED